MLEWFYAIPWYWWVIGYMYLSAAFVISVVTHDGGPPDLMDDIVVPSIWPILLPLGLVIGVYRLLYLKVFPVAGKLLIAVWNVYREELGRVVYRARVLFRHGRFCLHMHRRGLRRMKRRALQRFEPKTIDRIKHLVNK